MTPAASLLKLGRRPLVVALAAVLLVGVVFAGVAWRYHTVLVAEAQSRATRLSLLLSEQVARTFEAVDFTLRGFEPLFAADHTSDPVRLGELLRRRTSELGFVQTIRILDDQGRAVLASDPATQGTTDPGCLAALAEPTSEALAIGCTAGDLGSKGWPAIAMARRLTDPAGQFRGVIVADIDPGYFSRFFRNLDLSRHALVTLSENHGHVLLASTQPPQQDDVLPKPTLVPPTDRARLGELARSSHAQITAVHVADGYPLSVMVGIDRSDVDRGWWQVIGPAFALTVTASALLLALSYNLERHRAERARAAQRAVVAQKLEAMGQMTASVAHDFRNVLTALQGSLRIVRKRGPDAAVLDEAEAMVTRGNAMVDRLLAFSRRQDLRLELCDVNALVTDLAATLRHIAGLGTDLTLDLAPALPSCRLDRVQFDATLMNLVMNARQAMRDGGTITVSSHMAADETDLVVVSVRDTGAGIDPATLKRVFEPFFTTKVETGTGLGLAQVQSFSENVGGRVTIDSTVGVGTVVTLYLPGTVVPSSAPPVPEPATLEQV